jgi:hypothetical protein
MLLTFKFNAISMGISKRAGLTAKVRVIKPTKRHK